MFEDNPLATRKLINLLKDRPEIESVWSIGGTVWTRLVGRDRKLKFTIIDDVDRKITDFLATPVIIQAVPSTPNSPDPNATTTSIIDNPTSPVITGPL